MDRNRERTDRLVPGDTYADDRTLPPETDPATGESADDALEATRVEPEYRFPTEDADPEAVYWSTSPTQDSVQESEWNDPLVPPMNAQTGQESEDLLDARVPENMGTTRLVDESYFENEDQDLNDDEDAALRATSTPEDPHPGSRTLDEADADVLPSEEETTRGESARR